MTTTLDSPEQISMFRLLTLKSALGLECLGMKHSGGAKNQAYNIIKKEFGLTGTKAEVLVKFKAYIEELKNPSKTLAMQFGEALHAVQHSYELSNEVEAKFKPIVKKINGVNHFIFSDKSALKIVGNSLVEVKNA